MLQEELRLKSIVLGKYAVNSKDSLKDLVSLHPQIYILDRC